jgi:2-polyprenyl-3-methyl-5-hydroxy-6-metoxy-1,4-benzoquinol methylase
MTASADACIACEHALAASPWTHTAFGTLHACTHCGSLTGRPRPTAMAQTTLHDRPDYYDHPYFTLRRNAQSTRLRCRNTFSRIERAVGAGRLRGTRHLDIGCDTGTFLEAAAAQFGTIPFGVDVSRRAIEAARARGVDAFCGSLDELPRDVGAFRVITAIDLIEHVPHPGALLRAMGQRLDRDGVLYLETPNIRSVVYTIGNVFGRAPGRWARGLHDRLFPAEHIQYFTRAGLAALLQRAGFAIRAIGTRPLAGRDLGVPAPLRAGLVALQLADRVASSEILHWVVASRS